MADEGFKRKLAAILSADVEGYSRLMDDDEEATVRTLTSYRTAITDLVQQYRGRVVDSPGDNLLAEFASVVDAVNCAVEIQRDLAERNAELSYNRQMQFRIGINLGDVIEEDGRIYGDGVNIAARVESLAEAGGICISGRAHDQVENKLGLEYEDLGKHEVKNISRPIQVYRVLSYPGAAAHRVVQAKEKLGRKWRKIGFAAAVIVIVAVTIGIWQFYTRRPAIEPASVEKMAYPLPKKPSIAVLPFDNMSGDPEQEFFSDGLSEEIITALSSVPELFVIARNSTFTYKGKPVKVQQISEELGVQYVLEGSVRKSGDQVRITAQLIDALKGHHLWAESYDRKIEDLFAVQEEITVKIITELRTELTGQAQVRFSEPCSENLKAYLKYLKALDHFYRSTKEDNTATQRLAEEAIALDPEYACAYSLLGGTHMFDVYFGSTKSPKQSLATAHKMVSKAIDLNPSLAGPHGVLSHIYRTMGQFEKAMATAEKGLALGSNSVIANGAMGYILSQIGKFEESIQYFEKVIRIDPFAIRYFSPLGWSYFYSGQHKEAIRVCKRILDSKPNDFSAHLCLAATYSADGRKEEANTVASKILKMNPKFFLEKYSKSVARRYTKQTDREFLITNLRKAGLPDKPPLPQPDKPSIAVLPFVNMSGDPEQEYFSDGLTDELIGDLAKISGILVISRNSAFTYKGKQVKIAQIAKELNVRYVLEGSVQKSGGKVRIRAQLIDGQTDHHLWAESYDGVLNDIFDLQDKITGRIVSALAVKLTPAEQERVADKGTENVFAYEAFLKGEEYFLKHTPEDFLRAIEYYKQAVKYDPNFSRAYAAIGGTYQIGGNLNWARKMGSSSGTMRLLSRYYLELAMKNPTSEAYSLAAAKEIHRRNFQKSIAFAEKACDYAPNSAGRLTALAWKLAFAGKSEESIEFLKKAIRLDPLDTQKNTPICFLFIGVNHFSMGNLEEAITYLEKGLSMNPKLINFSCFLAASHALLGHDIEAKKALADYLKLFPKGFPVTIRLLYQAWPFKDSKVFDRFAQGLVKAGLRGDAADYHKLNSQEKLNEQEIKKLLFGKASSGFVWGIKPLEWRLNISNDGEVEYKYQGKTYTGKAWIEDENLCLLREEYHGGLKSCEAIYRNSDGDEIAKTEYFKVTDYGLFLFSVDK